MSCCLFSAFFAFFASTFGSGRWCNRPRASYTPAAMEIIEQLWIIQQKRGIGIVSSNLGKPWSIHQKQQTWCSSAASSAAAAAFCFLSIVIGYITVVIPFQPSPTPCDAMWVWPPKPYCWKNVLSSQKWWCRDGRNIIWLFRKREWSNESCFWTQVLRIPGRTSLTYFPAQWVFLRRRISQMFAVDKRETG